MTTKRKNTELAVGDFIKASGPFPYHVDSVDTDGIEFTEARPYWIRSGGHLSHTAVATKFAEGIIRKLTRQKELADAQRLWDRGQPTYPGASA